MSRDDKTTANKVAPGHTRIVRVASYSVASVLAFLMLTAVLPPLVADQSDRAVMNAPVTLLTAQIAGEIISLPAKPGLRVERGEPIAQIKNGRVDRTTLITLEGKAAEVREKALATKQKRDADLQYVAALDAEIRRQTDQLIGHFEGQVTELRARVAASEATGQEKKAVVDRQTAMVSRHVASPEFLKPSSEQYAGAVHAKEAEVAKLNQKLAQLNGLRKGIYVGDDLVGLATLAQKRRDIAFDAQRLAIEETQLTSSMQSQKALLDAERKRLDSLAEANLAAPRRGEVLNVGAAPGRHVSAGDTLASLVSCDDAFVAAIFSYRQAQDLAVGTRVRISSAMGSVSGLGTVKEILPKTSDKVDEQFAVPFPQTERREMYVLVTPDWAANGESRIRNHGSGPSASCPVGEWVTVTRDNGWVPSTSVVWRSVRDGLVSLAASIFHPNPAAAFDQRRFSMDQSS